MPRATGKCDVCGVELESIHIHPCWWCGRYVCPKHIMRYDHKCRPKCETCRKFMPEEDVLEGWRECIICDPKRDDPEFWEAEEDA